MNDRITAESRAADGWRHLRAFFSEGARRLPDAIAAFEEAERSMRRPVPAEGGAPGEEWDAVLIGLSVALRLRRDRDGARRAVALVQELLNITRRRSGDAAAVSLRAHLEDAYRDLAEIASGDDAVRAVEEGIEACDRTLVLARRFHVGAAAVHARATKAALLRRRAGAPPPGGGAPFDVRSLRREADRLSAAALSAWPARDAEGLAGAEVDLALALVEDARPRAAAIEKAERLLRRAAAAAPAGNRYLAARLARARARVALAGDHPDALDLIADAIAAFRELGLDRDAQEVERWL